MTRVREQLNAALHALFAEDERLYLLGQDVCDAYGGAFKVTQGLSTVYPDRILATPLSENATLGVGAGLAMAGDRVLVEVMFGDFAALAFDPLLNFASKTVEMYGRRVPVRLVVRCPVGGHRGYGPTHSQSVQKHLVGVPNLALFELSAMHDPGVLLRAAFDRGEPAVLFEDKVLYTQRMYRDGVVDEEYGFEHLPGPGHWVRVRRAGGEAAGAVVIAPGGTAAAALAALREGREATGVDVELLVPGQLYPCELAGVQSLLAAAGRVCVAEQSTAGGTWGAEVAAQVHEQVWERLKAPVRLVCSRPSVIPAAPHLERAVLLQPADITAALLDLVGRERGRPAPVQPAGGPHDDAPPAEHAVRLPALNSNDTEAIVVEWLVASGERVVAGTPVVTVETSKAATEIEADRDGVIRMVREAGEACRFGEILAYLTPVADAGTLAPPEPPAAPPAAPPALPAPSAPPADRVRRAIAAAVTRSHRDIPAAFCAAQVDLDPALSLLRGLSEEAVVDLPALVVKAIGLLHEQFPAFFGSVSPEGEFRPATGPDVAVTVDAGNGLFLPVVRGAHRRDLDEVADTLMEYRMLALEGGFSDAQLRDPAISVSLNLVEGITLVQPLVMPPQLCMVSVSGVVRTPRLGPGGTLTEASTTTVGLAYDHRFIDGSAATSFLSALRELIARPERIR